MHPDMWGLEGVRILYALFMSCNYLKTNEQL